MIPVKLILSGFLSYNEPVELDFTGFDLACISGANGAGKSSLLDAITWVLFGQARKRDESLINANSTTAEVQLYFDYEGNRYRVLRVNQRGKSGVLEFYIQAPDNSWKTLTERNPRETQARIEHTLRLDYETFINASFFLQGKADQFTQQRPGDRKRILAGILGLEIWEEYRKTAAEERKQVEIQVASLDGILKDIDTELDEEEERREQLARLEAELEQISVLRESREKNLENVRRITENLKEQKKIVEQLSRQVNEANQALQQTRNKLDDRMLEVTQFRSILARQEDIEAAYNAWQKAQVDLERLDAIAEKFREHQQRRQEPLVTIEKERSKLHQELVTLQQQAERSDAAQSDLAVKELELQESQRRADQYKSTLEGRVDAQAELQTAMDQLAEAKAENPRLKAEMQELKDRIDQLQDAEGAACPVCGQPLSETDRQALIATLQAEGEAMGNKYRANQELLKQADQFVQGLKSRLDEYARLEQNFIQETRKIDLLTERCKTIQSGITAWEADGAPRLKSVLKSLETEDFAFEAREFLGRIDAELLEIGYDASAHDSVRQSVIQGRTIDEEIRSLDRAQAAVEPLDREIAELQTMMENQQESVQTRQVEFDEANTKYVAAEETAPDLSQAQRELLDIKEQENRLHMQLGGAQQRVSVLEVRKNRKKVLLVEREDCSREISRYKLLERAFGKDGVPALLIEQALPEIENKANDILERLSDGTMAVKFITQTEYKDRRRDDLRETLDIQIRDGAGIRDYELYSGGEAFRVNFAIRLALSEVLAQRAGARLQTLIIDEGFGSQDTLGRQRLIEAINLIRDDFAKIIVITHIDELKDAFPVRIEVSKTLAGSQLAIY
jgi:DNA repair protein SbcC/Rad50